MPPAKLTREVQQLHSGQVQDEDQRCDTNCAWLHPRQS